MKITYQTQRLVRCPVDGATIAYTIKIESTETIYVEDINSALDEVSSPSSMQEPMTEFLIKRFPKCKITTMGTHGGVHVVCEGG
jgi:hypothetical protein